MHRPEEQDWLRAETLAEQLSALTSDEVSARLRALATSGESELVLELARQLIADRPAVTGLKSGTSFNGFRLISILGAGSMGTVWRARQELIERDVAVKVIHAQLIGPDRHERFLREMRTLGKLSHPGLVQVYGAGIHDAEGMTPMPFFAMELVEGLPLHEWAADQHRPVAVLLRVMAAVCAAVQSAHDRQIIHRDLKPANILVRPDGRPVVLDFGISQLMGAETAATEGGFEGTPVYAAPEQFLGRTHSIQELAGVDLYSIGVILFELLAGRLPFDLPDVRTLSRIRQTKLEGRVLRLAEAWRECPPVLDEIISRTVRREPLDRVYSTLAELGRALDAAASRLDLDAPAEAPWKPQAGAVIPRTRWQLDSRLGEGGVGEVWRGHHQELGDQRVFKFCDSEEKARTLRRELTVYRLLRDRVGQNPHFVPLLEVSLAEAPWYLMMEDVDAVDLPSWCAARPGGLNGLDAAHRTEIAAQVAEALQAAHEAGILHRDIKPSNLLIRGQANAGSGGLHVLIADFGIGQIVAEDLVRSGGQAGFTRTVSGMARSTVSGSLFYLAPEVLGGQPATARSDIYSLGVVLWQLLAGNFNTALDPADWASHITNSHLRSDLAKCLAGKPERRWQSAGELAVSLRQLPDRERAERRRQEELEARERRAYRRGVAGTAAVAVFVVAGIMALAGHAMRQQRVAEQRLAENHLERLKTLDRTDLQAGRRERGLGYWALAAEHSTDQTELRSAAARVLGLSDLVPQKPGAIHPSIPALLPEGTAHPKLPDETARTASANGQWLAIARDRNGTDGLLNLVDLQSGITKTIGWTNFPWLPVGEPELVRFSPDSQRLTVGGGATSRNLLILKIPDGGIETYLFHPSDILTCAWHPVNRQLATGCADHSIRLWDLSGATLPFTKPGSSNSFELPPLLNVPALDRPQEILRGHREAVRFLAFSTDGRWLASLDAGGLLQVHQGFHSERPSQTNSENPGIHGMGHSFSGISLAVESLLKDPESVVGLTFVEQEVRIRRASGEAEVFSFLPQQLPSEQFVGPGTTHLAWTRDGTRLCVLTADDAQWLKSSTFEFSSFHQNVNADGILPGPGPDSVTLSLISPSQERNRVHLMVLDQNRLWSPELLTSLSLDGLSQTDTAPLVATDDGRFVVRVDRRFLFLDTNHVAISPQPVQVGNPGERVTDWFWDSRGTLFGVFLKTDTRARLLLWPVARDQPVLAQEPSEFPLPMHSRVTAAQDGKHVFTRNITEGVVTRGIGEPGSSRVLDASPEARQERPLAATHDGRFLAMVVDRHRIQLLALPSGRLFAEFSSPRLAPIQHLEWKPDGRQLAGVTEDGFILVWNLQSWFEMLSSNHIASPFQLPQPVAIQP